MLVVVDIGVNNLASVKRAFQRVGADVHVASGPEFLGDAKAIVLPGVGAFADGMAKLKKQNFVSALHEASARGVPILGICLGMQLLAEHSDEGGACDGLGLVEGRCIRLDPRMTVDRVPNIGWCDVEIAHDSNLFRAKNSGQAFYFANSFHFDCDVQHRTASFRFGGRDITAAVECGNIFGVQFHPEKSQDVGLDVLSAFIRRLEA